LQSIARANQALPKSHSKLDKNSRFSPDAIMIGQFIALYKARKDSSFAKRLASEMIVDGVIGRAGWPLTIAKFWMTIGIIALTALVLLFLTLGTLTHWTLAIPALLFGGGVYGIVKLWRGVNAGVEHVTELAKTELGNRAASLTVPSIRSKKSPDQP